MPSILGPHPLLPAPLTPTPQTSPLTAVERKMAERASRSLSREPSRSRTTPAPLTSTLPSSSKSARTPSPFIPGSTVPGTTTTVLVTGGLRSSRGSGETLSLRWLAASMGNPHGQPLVESLKVNKVSGPRPLPGLGPSPAGGKPEAAGAGLAAAGGVVFPLPPAPLPRALLPAPLSPSSQPLCGKPSPPVPLRTSYPGPLIPISPVSAWHAVLGDLLRSARAPASSAASAVEGACCGGQARSCGE
eukprot:RCo020805